MKVGTDAVLLGAWAQVKKNDARALDIGAGSGVLALMLAQKMEAVDCDFFIDAVEIDGPSAGQARANFQKSSWADRLEIFEASIQDFAKKTSVKYDLIVSNPPFFGHETHFSGPTINAARHNFQLPTGELLAAVRAVLADNGRFLVVLPHLEGLRFAELAAQRGLYLTRQMDVYSKSEKPCERLLMQFERSALGFEKEVLTIYDGPDYSEKYRKLTADFYLDF